MRIPQPDIRLHRSNKDLRRSKQTSYKYFPYLERDKIVIVSRKIGRAKLYKINLEHPLVEIVKGI